MLQFTLKKADAFSDARLPEKNRNISASLELRDKFPDLSCIPGR